MMRTGPTSIFVLEVSLVARAVYLAFLFVLSDYGITSIPGSVDAAEALYAFGDSFVDTGNSNRSGWGYPYGCTWPGYATGRWSDGRSEVDYLAELFGLPSPTPYGQIKDNESVGGINFGFGGAGVTYAFGYRSLSTQVDEFEGLVEGGVLSKKHLARSVALVALAINDYSAFNIHGSVEAVPAMETTVVDGIAYSVWRIYNLGIRNIMVANVVPMPCVPFITAPVNFTECVNNVTINNETVQHNLLLEKALGTLNKGLKGAHIVLLNQTKAFEYLINNGEDYGFVKPLAPCCTGKYEYNLTICGYLDSEGEPLYTVCEDPSKSVFFDGVHPTEAAWKAVIDLYSSVSGFTHLGPMLKTWARKYDV